MIQETTESLMWQKIDGTITPEDETRLEATLKQDAEAREHFGELLKFSELLGGVEELEPPTALRQKVEGAIDFDRYAAREKSATPGFLRGWFPIRGNLRFAAAATAGFVVGIMVYHLATYRPGASGSFDNSDLVGTIGQVENGIEIDLETVQGTISFRRENALGISEVDIQSQREIELYLEYDGQSVQFGAVGDVDSPLHDISIADNTIVLRNLGSAEYFAAFHREDGTVVPLKVRIVSEGEVLLEKEIRPGHPR
jgi:hypothetical protein